MLDHAPRGRENDKSYACPDKGEMPDDPSHPIRMRFEEHKRSIEELNRLFIEHPDVGQRCRLVLPIVNKRDAWETLGYTIHIFTDWYFELLNELTSTLAFSKVVLNRPIALAGKWEGFDEAFNIVEEKAGHELKIKLMENWFSTAIMRIPLKKK